MAPPPALSRSPLPPVKWCSPAVNCFKMNVDASLDSARQLVGIKVVIRNHFSLVLGSLWQRIFTAYSPTIAEAVVLHRGLNFASEFGVMLHFVESDSSTMVDLVNCCVTSCADPWLSYWFSWL
ncbi:hypothetical protein ACOSQ4_002955 [Xanthoceras sorbifolium]